MTELGGTRTASHPLAIVAAPAASRVAGGARLDGPALQQREDRVHVLLPVRPEAIRQRTGFEASADREEELSFLRDRLQRSRHRSARENGVFRDPLDRSPRPGQIRMDTRELAEQGGRRATAALIEREPGAPRLRVRRPRHATREEVSGPLELDLHERVFPLREPGWSRCHPASTRSDVNGARREEAAGQESDTRVAANWDARSTTRVLDERGHDLIIFGMRPHFTLGLWRTSPPTRGDRSESPFTSTRITARRGASCPLRYTVFGSVTRTGSSSRVLPRDEVAHARMQHRLLTMR